MGGGVERPKKTRYPASVTTVARASGTERNRIIRSNKVRTKKKYQGAERGKEFKVALTILHLSLWRCFPTAGFFKPAPGKTKILTKALAFLFMFLFGPSLSVKSFSSRHILPARQATIVCENLHFEEKPENHFFL